MNDKGFIQLHRKLLRNPVVCKDSDYLAVWIWLLLNAVWDSDDVTFGGQRIRLKPGQLTTGRKKIASELRISESKVQRILKRFESEHQIEQRTDRQCRLITIVSWSEYQSCEQRNEQEVNNERTTSEQRVNTNKEYKTINTLNKGTNNNGDLTSEFEELWKIYPRKKGKDSALKKYIQHRNNGTTYEEVLQGVRCYASYIKSNRIEEKYIKYGSSFFNQKSWQDDWGADRVSKFSEESDELLDGIL